MEQRLEVAAREGNIDALYFLMKEDAYLLERIEKVPFIDTPLHVAASAGQVRFAMEIMRLKPSFARKLNQNGHSPIHLGLQNEQTNLVLCLLDVDRDLVRVQGREGKTALHFAAECRMVDLLAVFLSVCPESIHDLTIRKETALHVAVKSNNLEAFKVLLEWLEHVGKDGVLKWSDDEGNTILQVAESRNQVEVVDSLIARGVDVQAVKMAEVTALDISNQPNELGNPEITDILGKQESRDTIINARALKAASLAKQPFKYLRRNERLREVRNAAQFGDTEILLSLIQKDPCILERFDDLPYVETPLHIAARLGHFNFAREIMRWKPSFAKKPNQEGLCPIHLATQNDRIRTLKQLLSFDKGLVRLQGREGKTSLHYAAERGKVDLLDTLLSACPPAMEDVTDLSDTALHIAIKHSKFKAFFFLLRRLQTAIHEGSTEQETKILNFQDGNGSTVLHIAVEMNRHDVVEWLIDSGVKVNVKNSANRTALDIAEGQGQAPDNTKIKEMLARASRSTCSLFRCKADFPDCCAPKSPWKLPKPVIFIIRYKRGISMESRNLLLCVSVLIAAITYQTAVDPPKNSRRDDNNNGRNLISCFLDNPITNFSSPNSTIVCSMHNSNTTSHQHGLSIASVNEALFWTSNILALLSSTLTIPLLLPGTSFIYVMLIPLYCFLCCYTVTIRIAGSPTWCLVMGFLFIISIIMLTYFYLISQWLKRKEKITLRSSYSKALNPPGQAEILKM